MSIFVHEDPIPVLTDTDDAGTWVVVGTDPSSVRYFDDEAEAIDEINWDVVISALDSDDEIPDWHNEADRADGDWTIVPAHHLQGNVWHDVWDLAPAGISFGQTMLIVRTGSNAFDVWEDHARALANYPILDEDELSKRESASWEQWVDSGGLGRDLSRRSADVVAAIVDAGGPADGWQDLDFIGTEHDPSATLDELVTMYIRDQVEDYYFDAMNGMAYWEGWHGSFDEDGAIGAVADRCAAVWRMMTLIATAGHDWHNEAHGIVRLPLVWA